MEIISSFFFICFGVLSVILGSLLVIFVDSFLDIAIAKKELELDALSSGLEFRKVVMGGPPARSSTELQEYIEGSKNHPEVSEIEDTDQIVKVRFGSGEDEEFIGVSFPGATYPPMLDEEDGDSEES